VLGIATVLVHSRSTVFLMFRSAFPIKSIQMTENGVPIIGNEPNNAFPAVPFETFLYHKSHDDTYLITKL